MDLELQKLLVAIYNEDYLIDTQFYLNDSNYLVYGAKLTCTHGSTPAYLKLEETIDPYTERKMIGHGITINGLPAANKSDAKPDINIGDFGICDLISDKKALCTNLKNFALSWNVEGRPMYVGSERGITKKSTLTCTPCLYSSTGIIPGEIKAVDSGQMNLWYLIEKYRADYLTELVKSIKKQKNVLTDVAGTVPRDEVIYLYELYYPDRGAAFDEFSKTANSIYSEHVKNMKFMTYMLAKDEYTKCIIQYMVSSAKYHLEIYNVSDVTDPNEDPARAYFKSLGNKTAKMVMNDITNKSNLVPPYKVFFHESGHAVDYFSSSTETSYHDTFRYEANAEIGTLMLDLSNNLIKYKTHSKLESKSIHEWAEYDVKQMLYTTGVEVLNNSTTPEIKNLNGYQKLDHLIDLINNYFLCWDGADKFKTASQSMREVYSNIQNEINVKLMDTNGIINIGKDIYGGITGNQLGVGHGLDYWFYVEEDDAVKNGQKAAGDRKTLISGEAFAGYFEYTVMGVMDGLTPAKKTLPMTLKALTKMMEEIL